MPASGAAGANAFPLPVANPARQQQGAGTSGRGSGPDNGFRGWPRAQVVAPEILTEASKDYVAYKIRVADDSGEWTVTRRCVAHVSVCLPRRASIADS